MGVQTSLEEIEEAISARRLSPLATETAFYPSGAGSSVRRDIDGLLWVHPSCVRVRHLPVDADPHLLLDDGFATALFGYWRAVAQPSGSPVEVLQATDPEWFGGAEPSTKVLAALGRPSAYIRYMGVAGCRLTGEHLGSDTHFWAGESQIYACPDSMLHYLSLGMRPRHEAWTQFCAEADAGTLRTITVRDRGGREAQQALMAAVGTWASEWREWRLRRVLQAMGHPDDAAPPVAQFHPPTPAP